VRFKQDRNFALAAASLRQALQDMPDIVKLSKHVMVEQTKKGLNIENMDQTAAPCSRTAARNPTCVSGG
jgi:chemotaxis protein MotB